MTSFLFSNCRLFDPNQSRLLDGMEVLIEDELVREVSDRPLRTGSATRIDLAGMTLMPGLIDAHVHVVSSLIPAAANAMQFSSLAALRCGRVMNGMLMRGFTTVRDLGGADLGLAIAVEEGLIEGPRLVICGKALSQTGGHSDGRGRSDDRGTFGHRDGALGRLVDGVDALRLACREEIKGGAQFVKLMANGGVASPNDPLHALGFCRAEIEAAVEEAFNAGLYVAAHLYTDQAIRRAVECGVHSLEHCNLIQAETAKFAVDHGAFAIPTLVAYEGLAREGAALGLSPESQAKIEPVRRAGLESLDIMRSAGLPMAFGTDLLGGLHHYQSMEFELRAHVLPISEILKSATLVAARLLRMEGKIGILAPDAFADLLVVDGDPTRDLGVLQRDGANLKAIMRGGKFCKNELH